MNKVFVTGLGVGHDLGFCQACNLDFSWLIRNPSTLLWADKIIITKSAWEAQKSRNQDKFDKAINLVLDIAFTNNSIELINPVDVISDIGHKIYDDVLIEMEKLEQTFPEIIKRGTDTIPNELIINGKSFCGPKVASIYASLKISEELDANCLLGKWDYEYLKYKHGINNSLFSNKDKIMDEVMTLYLPDELVLHNYAFTDENSCSECVNLKDCSKNYLNEIEDSTNKIISWKNYDEIITAKKELENIVDIKQAYGHELNVQEIKREFTQKQNKINTNINKIFPKVKRWTNLTIIIATPISIYSLSTANTYAALTAAGAVGVGKVIGEAMKYYENKNNWVGFLNKIKINKK